MQARVAELEKRVEIRGDFCRTLEAAKQQVEDERDGLAAKCAELIHYPDCWDTVAYPALQDALNNIDADYQGCTECVESARTILAAPQQAAEPVAIVQPEQPAPTSEFERGALTAIALIIRCHDAESLAFDILNEMGLNGADCSELDECDKEDLSQLIGYRGAKLRGLTRPAAPDSIATCEWREDADGIWETACGEAWVCTEGTPVENDMKYCHSCGKHLKEMPYAATGGE